MSRLPLLFIVTGMIGFVLFHAASLASLSSWIGEGLRGPTGWFQTHLFVLGWATMLAMGATYQLINVILQSNLYSERLGYIHYAFFTVGLSGLLYGFLRGEVSVIAAFASLTFVGVLLFAWNMAVTLRIASRWNPITVSAACAVLYLVLTGLSGMSMGVNFVTGWWSEFHNRLFAVHIWFGTVGWFGMLITGFSYKMLPMFYLAHQYPASLQRAVLLLWNAGAVFGAASFLLGGDSWTTGTAFLLVTLAIVVYNVHIAQIRKHRHKRSPGSGIRWSMYGNHAFAGAAIALLAYALLHPQHLFHARFVTLTGWVYLAGWVSFMILCYASKIVPFLWWTMKYGQRAGTPGIPVMSDLLNGKKAEIGLAAVAFFTLVPAAGLVAESPLIIAVGGTLYSLCSIAYISLIAFVFSK